MRALMPRPVPTLRHLPRLHFPLSRAVHTSPPRQNLAPAPRPHLLPEFSLKDKVIVVSGGARGLGLVQAEALLEAGATGQSLPR